MSVEAPGRRFMGFSSQTGVDNYALLYNHMVI